ncbi:uncharacterized protein LOC128214060 [Mya arenaria]|uniref:uncharacterized protein LOC128214060 n=1 Tax=Mya arenaria TaxID=6604 RepID=UPI0022E881EF|nr:uncharacterized protein LOC128214060 [Mya arenaria]XP_052776259.1 uncharacterized protein LOC128214060 [Mya arenaria]XP_052776260.1 uncharacterized protein LOC128214060 [Mya arenaria]
MEENEEDEDSELSLLEYMPDDLLLEIFKLLNWRDLIRLSATCTKFRQICSISALWLSLRKLKFVDCHIPDSRKILEVLQRSSNAEHIILDDVLIEDNIVAQSTSRNELEAMEMTEGPDRQGPVEGSVVEGLQPPDRFILDVLKLCPHVAKLDLYMKTITDRAVEAICAKCVCLRHLQLCENDNISRDAINELVSYCPSLMELCLDECRCAEQINLRHRDADRTLNLHTVRIHNVFLSAANVDCLLASCPQLIILDLSHTLLTAFVIQPSQPGQRNPLETLKELVLETCQYLLGVMLPFARSLLTLNVTECRSLKDLKGDLPMLETLEARLCTCLKELDVNVPSLTYFSFDSNEHGSLEQPQSRTVKLRNCSMLEEASLSKLSTLTQLHIGSTVLRNLNLAMCPMMSVTELVCVVPDPSSLVTLNISGCVNISPSDLQTDLLPKFSGLQSLTYGGHSWNTVQLSSPTLSHIVLQSCRNLSHLGLNMAGLRKLTLDLCPDLVEQELFDPLIYGRSITRLQGLENIVAHNLPPPFANGVGLPCLEELKCLNLCGLHGDVMSKCLGEFQCLTYLEFEHCAFLTQLRVCGWAKIKTVKFIGCCNLKKLDISNVPNLHYLYLKGCSMMDHCSIDAQNLSHLDTSGTNYRHLCVASNKLETLQVNGICTQESHTFSLRCNNLQDLSISKCDRLSDQVVNAVFSGCPNLSFIYILGSLIIRSLTLPASLTKCSLTGHRLLANIHVSPQNRIQHLTLNNLPKFIPSQRAELLRRCEGSLQELEVRAIPGETTLRLTLPELSALTLDQGIHLQSLDISCPKLKSLRIQGCPHLHELSMHVTSLAQMHVFHSPPLLALQRLILTCPRVPHLDRILAYYCRKLQALTLRGSTVKESLIYRLGQALPSLNTLQLDTCTLTGAPATLNSFCVDGKALFRNDGLTLSVVIARQMI